MITKRSREYNAVLSRRSLILGGIQGVLVSGLAARLYYLQMIEGQQYSTLSDRNKYDFRLITPSRGRIYDAGGRLLAGNAEAYQLSIIPDYAGDAENILRILSELITLEEDDITAILEEVRSTPSFLPVLIRSDLTQREVARLVVRSPELPGVSFEKTEKRIYPQGLLAGHVTGYVNRVTQSEINSGAITRELAAINTGKSGAEKAFEKNLRGEPGRERILVNAFGRPIRTAIDEESLSGGDVRLTANMDLQLAALGALKRGSNTPIPRGDKRVQRAIERQPELGLMLPETEEFAYIDSKGRIVPPESGSVVVVDVKTGAVRCLASAPTFDPNLFSGRISSSEWQLMINNPRQPLLNRALSGQYAPGSTFKMAVALAALEAGIINEKTRFSCPGHKTVGNQDFHCWQEFGHGSVNIVEAIEQSCDVFFYELGLKTGITRIAEMARRLSFGDVTGINLPGEKNGLMPTKEWKKKKIGRVWTLGETVNASIGQGYVLSTPLQLAVMTARLASGQMRVMPRITETDYVPEFEPLDINPYALKVIRKGMRRGMNGDKGTARRHDLTIGSGMAGKTGTVQVRAISKAEREQGVTDNADRPWKFRDHALFTGYAPYDDPRYAISVVVEHGGSGSGAAAPVARQVMSWLLENEA